MKKNFRRDISIQVTIYMDNRSVRSKVWLNDAQNLRLADVVPE